MTYSETFDKHNNDSVSAQHKQEGLLIVWLVHLPLFITRPGKKCVRQGEKDGNIYHLKEANEGEERAALSRFIPL